MVVPHTSRLFRRAWAQRDVAATRFVYTFFLFDVKNRFLLGAAFFELRPYSYSYVPSTNSACPLPPPPRDASCLPVMLGQPEVASETTTMAGEAEEEPGLELEHAIGFSGSVLNHLSYQKMTKNNYIYAAGGSVVLSDFDDPHEQVLSVL